MSQRSYTVAVIGILLASLMLRAGAAVWWQQRLDRTDSRFVFGDSESYWVLATQIASGLPYQYGGPDASVFRVPLYPMCLSLLIDPASPSDGILWARLFGCVMGTLAVGAVIVLTSWMFDRRSALVTGVLASIYPGGISMSILILSEAIFILLMILHLMFWRQAYLEERDRASVGWSLAGGAVAGLAVLARPSWLLFVPFACLFQLLTGAYRRTVLIGLCSAIGMAIVMMPWWIRNYHITDKFVLTTLQVGASMYDGLGPQATGASDTGMSFVERFQSEQRAADAESAELDGTFEYRLDRRMSAASKKWVIDNPGRVIQLAAVKFGRIWRPWPTAEEVPGRFIRIGTAAGMLMIVIPAMIGLWQYRDNAWPIYLIALPTLYFTALHCVSIGSMRYRLPAVFLLTIIAAPVIAGWISKIAQRSYGRSLG